MLDFDLSLPVQDWLPTQLYPGFRPGLPDIVLGRLPASLAKLAGHPFKSWILENLKEAERLQARLAEPLPLRPDGSLDFIAGPDSAVYKKGRGASPVDVVVAIYSPPEPGWPYIALTSLPAYDVNLERGCYAWEAFDDQQGAIEHLKVFSTLSGGPFKLHGPNDLEKH